MRWPLVVGAALLVLGSAVLGFYWLLYDTAVVDHTGGGWPEERRVHTLERVSARLAGMIGGGVLSIIGTLLCMQSRAKS